MTYFYVKRNGHKAILVNKFSTPNDEDKKVIEESKGLSLGIYVVENGSRVVKIKNEDYPDCIIHGSSISTHYSTYGKIISTTSIPNIPYLKSMYGSPITVKQGLLDTEDVCTGPIEGVEYLASVYPFSFKYVAFGPWSAEDNTHIRSLVRSSLNLDMCITQARKVRVSYYRSGISKDPLLFRYNGFKEVIHGDNWNSPTGYTRRDHVSTAYLGEAWAITFKIGNEFYPSPGSDRWAMVVTPKELEEAIAPYEHLRHVKPWDDLMFIAGPWCERVPSREEAGQGYHVQQAPLDRRISFRDWVYGPMMTQHPLIGSKMIRQDANKSARFARILESYHGR